MLDTNLWWLESNQGPMLQKQPLCQLSHNHCPRRYKFEGLYNYFVKIFMMTLFKEGIFQI